MSSVSPASELLSEPSGSVPTDLAERQGQLPAYLRQALQMLDLQPAVEIAKYRSYQASKLNTDDQLGSVITAPEEEEEDYEEIPPSQPFAVMDRARAHSPEPPGKLVFKEAESPAASLDLSLLPPGEISSARNEYLPASQELWRSLGKPAAPVVAKVPRWKLPVAIGSIAVAIATVAGMTYVNLHPLLLQQVPVVAQLTTPPVLPAIPPGQSLQGPDLASGEFSDLSLGNLNSITLPSNAVAVAQNPLGQNPGVATAVFPPVTPMIAAPNGTAPVVAAVTTTPTTGARLSDTLIRNLLPPNIQQMAERAATPLVPQVPVAPSIQPAVKPYVPPANVAQPKSKKTSAATKPQDKGTATAKKQN